MPDTPGQIAYTAWWTSFGDGQPDLRDGEPWARLTGRQHRAWEAAAQAVLTAAAGSAPGAPARRGASPEA